MTAVQPFVPATEALLSGWTGPGRLAPPHARMSRWPAPDETVAIYRVFDGSVYVVDGDGDRYDAPPDLVRLDTRRREVQHLLCDRLALPEWVRGSEWCAALTWWSALSGRMVVGVWSKWGGNRTYNTRRAIEGFIPYIILNSGGDLRDMEICVAPNGWHIRRGVPSMGSDRNIDAGPETGDAGKAAADLAALAHDCALLIEVDGRRVLTLPPLVSGGEPIVWGPS